MARFFSDHYSTIVSSATVKPATAIDGTVKSNPGLAGNINYKVAHLDFESVATGDFTTGDQFRYFNVASGDRPIELFISSVGSEWTGTSIAAAFGLYEQGLAHDGPLIDTVLFHTHNVPPAKNRAERLFGSAGSLDGLGTNRGEPFWRLASIGAGASNGVYLEDPLEVWDLTVTFTFTAITATGEMQVELFYIPGGTGG